jgi:drug/metabolite transporter (DMT)-like permease
MQKDRKTALHFLVLGILALTWGSSFILMKRGLQTPEGLPVFSPEQVAALRMSIASFVLLPISIPALRRIDRKDLKWLAIVGLVGSGFPAFLFTMAQKHHESSIAGILNSLTPLFTILLGMIIFGRKGDSKKFLGILIGLAGAALLLALKWTKGEQHWDALLLIVLATAFYGLSVNVIPHALTHVKPLAITAISLLFIGLPCFIYSLNNGAINVVRENEYGAKSLMYIAILATGGTVVANSLYFWLTQKTNAVFASSVTFLMPLVAMAWGIGDGEILSFWYIIAAGIMLSGIYLIKNSGKN